MCFLSVSSAHAQTFIRDYTYKASEADSKITSRTIALDQVKIVLLQEIGTHIRQKISVTKDGSGNTYASEDVEALTAGFTSVEVMEEKWNGDTYYLKAKLVADTDKVLNSLKSYKNSDSEKNKQLEELKANKIILDKTRKEVNKLKKQLFEVKEKKQKEKIIIKYVNKINDLSASEMYTKAWAYLEDGKDEEAAYWFRKSAELKYVLAQTKLSTLYIFGLGVNADSDKALFWAKKAASQGFAEGQVALGMVYLSLKEYQKSLFWIQKAVDQGSHKGMFRLGMAYSRGLGVKQDYDKAFYWIKKSAEKDEVAQFHLGHMYTAGEGVKKDTNKAMYWYRKSHDSGFKAASIMLNTLEPE